MEGGGWRRCSPQPCAALTLPTVAPLLVNHPRDITGRAPRPAYEAEGAGAPVTASTDFSSSTSWIRGSAASSPPGTRVSMR